MNARKSAVSSLGAMGCLALVGLGAAGCDGRERRAGEERDPLTGPSIAIIDLSRGIPELATAGLFGPTPARSHADLVEALRELDDEEVKGVLVRLDAARIGFARAEEVGRMLGRIRAAGKPVYCHAHAYNNSSYMLAAMGCSEVWVSPAGEVETVGIAAQLVFARSLLERFNITADFVQVGKYKGAKEPFTRDEPSPEARESLEGTLTGMRRAWIDNIKAGRDDESIELFLEDGPWAAIHAEQQGIVDHIGFWDEAKDAAKKAGEAVRFEPVFGGRDTPQSGFLEALRALSGAEGGAPHVAVVRAVGGITMAPSASLFGGGGGITERRLSRTLRKLRDDESTKAVVIRIESPGGSALASDLLWKDLMRLREEKPVVFSVGGMAASGGYYLACAGQEIFAEKTSILGSMGVVSGKFAVGGALADVGVYSETIAASPDPDRQARAAYLSPFDPWDAPTRARMHESATQIYNLFLQRVAEGRDTTVEDVEPSAEGRIFSGAEAHERGLVDHLGGLNQAIDRALELADLPEDAPVNIVREATGLAEILGGEGAQSRMSQQEAEERVLDRARRAVNPLSPVVAELPDEVRAFLQGSSGLARGEHTLVGMPYVVVVR